MKSQSQPEIIDCKIPSPRILDVDEQAKALDTIDFPKGTEGEYSS